MGAGASLLHWTISRERLQRHSRFASGANRGSGMHVLMTADTVGGVWTYTQELVSRLIQQGIRVTLVSLGKLPSPQQSAWIDALPELDYRPTDYRLEWMQDSEWWFTTVVILRGSTQIVRKKILFFQLAGYGIRRSKSHYCCGAIRQFPCASQDQERSQGKTSVARTNRPSRISN